MKLEQQQQRHFQALEAMYNEGAPINQWIMHRVSIRDNSATVTWEVNPQFFHAAGALHGSIYFKMLDDAAFFAANSIDREHFVLTASMNVQFFKPVTTGHLLSNGTVIMPGKGLIYANSELRDDRGRLVAAGQGTFMRSTIRLLDVSSYLKAHSEF